MAHKENTRSQSKADIYRWEQRLQRIGLTSLRNDSLLFLASSLEVSASAVFVENCNNTIKDVNNRTTMPGFPIEHRSRSVPLSRRHSATTLRCRNMLRGAGTLYETQIKTKCSFGLFVMLFSYINVADLLPQT